MAITGTTLLQIDLSRQGEINYLSPDELNNLDDNVCVLLKKSDYTLSLYHKENGIAHYRDVRSFADVNGVEIPAFPTSDVPAPYTAYVLTIIPTGDTYYFDWILTDTYYDDNNIPIPTGPVTITYTNPTYLVNHFGTYVFNGTITVTTRVPQVQPNRRYSNDSGATWCTLTTSNPYVFEYVSEGTYPVMLEKNSIVEYEEIIDLIYEPKGIPFHTDYIPTIIDHTVTATTINNCVYTGGVATNTGIIETITDGNQPDWINYFDFVVSNGSGVVDSSGLMTGTTYNFTGLTADNYHVDVYKTVGGKVIVPSITIDSVIYDTNTYYSYFEYSIDSGTTWNSLQQNGEIYIPQPDIEDHCPTSLMFLKSTISGTEIYPFIYDFTKCPSIVSETVSNLIIKQVGEVLDLTGTHKTVGTNYNILSPEILRILTPTNYDTAANTVTFTCDYSGGTSNNMYLHILNPNQLPYDIYYHCIYDGEIVPGYGRHRITLNKLDDVFGLHEDMQTLYMSPDLITFEFLYVDTSVFTYSNTYKVYMYSGGTAGGCEMVANIEEPTNLLWSFIVDKYCDNIAGIGAIVDVTVTDSQPITDTMYYDFTATSTGGTPSDSGLVTGITYTFSGLTTMSNDPTYFQFNVDKRIQSKINFTSIILDGVTYPMNTPYSDFLSSIDTGTTFPNMLTEKVELPYTPPYTHYNTKIIALLKKFTGNLNNISGAIELQVNNPAVYSGSANDIIIYSLGQAVPAGSHLTYSANFIINTPAPVGVTQFSTLVDPIIYSVDYADPVLYDNIYLHIVNLSQPAYDYYIKCTYIGSGAPGYNNFQLTVYKENNTYGILEKMSTNPLVGDIIYYDFVYLNGNVYTHSASVKFPIYNA